MDTKQKILDTITTLTIGVGNLVLNSIDVISKVVTLVVALLSGAYLIWKWMHDIKKEKRDRNFHDYY